MLSFLVDAGACVGCLACVRVCPTDAIEVVVGVSIGTAEGSRGDDAASLIAAADAAMYAVKAGRREGG